MAGEWTIITWSSPTPACGAPRAAGPRGRRRAPFTVVDRLACPSGTFSFGRGPGVSHGCPAGLGSAPRCAAWIPPGWPFSPFWGGRAWAPRILFDFGFTLSLFIPVYLFGWPTSRTGPFEARPAATANQLQQQGAGPLAGLGVRPPRGAATWTGRQSRTARRAVWTFILPAGRLAARLSRGRPGQDGRAGRARARSGELCGGAFRARAC